MASGQRRTSVGELVSAGAREPPATVPGSHAIQGKSSTSVSLVVSKSHSDREASVSVVCVSPTAPRTWGKPHLGDAAASPSPPSWTVLLCTAVQAPEPRRRSVPPGRVLRPTNLAANGSPRLPPSVRIYPSLFRARSHPRLVLCAWQMRRPLMPHARPDQGGRHGGGPPRGVPRRERSGRDRRQANQAQLDMDVGHLDTIAHRTPVEETIATRDKKRDNPGHTNDESELGPQNHPAPHQA